MRPLTSYKLQNKKQRLNVKEGKISISNSLRNCQRCERMGQEISILRGELFEARKELREEKLRNKEMSIICSEIEKTKLKLLKKMAMRHESHMEPNGNDTSRTVKISAHSLRSRPSMT